VLASVGLFIGYIAHIANLIRVATIITYVGDQSRRVLETRYPSDTPMSAPRQPLPAPVRTIPTPRAGVVVSVNDQVLARLAADMGCVLVLAVRVGDFVPAGAPLFAVHPHDADVGTGAEDRQDRRIPEEVALDTERTMEQDLAFGFRQLVDIVERALSPAVNDPTTASQAIDVLHDLLRALATRQLPDGRSWGQGGRLCLVVPQYGFGEFLDLAVGEIWRYGADAAQIPGRLAAMLADLDTAALPGYRPAIAGWAQRIGGAATAAGGPPAAPAPGQAEGSSGTA